MKHKVVRILDRLCLKKLSETEIENISSALEEVCQIEIANYLRKDSKLNNILANLKYLKEDLDSVNYEFERLEEKVKEIHKGEDNEI